MNALAKLSKAIDDFATATPSGGTVSDPRFAPFANNADMEHFLQRHSIEHFDFAQSERATHFPEGHAPEQIQDGIAEALDFIRRSGDAFPDNSPRFHRLATGCRPDREGQWYDRAVLPLMAQASSHSPERS